MGQQFELASSLRTNCLKFWIELCSTLCFYIHGMHCSHWRWWYWMHDPLRWASSLPVLLCPTRHRSCCCGWRSENGRNLSFLPVKPTLLLQSFLVHKCTFSSKRGFTWRQMSPFGAIRLTEKHLAFAVGIPEMWRRLSGPKFPWIVVSKGTWKNCQSIETHWNWTVSLTEVGPKFLWMPVSWSPRKPVWEPNGSA